MFLIPVHKKGEYSDPNNYRGISLISCIAKLFTTILNKRLLKWGAANDVLTDAQFGFRPGFGTIDAIFALEALICSTLSKGKRLYCCFVDYKRAFDTVDRTLLWTKLSYLGIRGKLLNVLRSFYNGTKTTIRIGNEYTDFFRNNVKYCHLYFSLFMLTTVKFHL